MKFTSTWTMALPALRRNPLRTGLTMLGGIDGGKRSSRSSRHHLSVAGIGESHGVALSGGRGYILFP